MSGITFDAGGLIALDRNDRRVLALVARAMDLGIRITVPATALAYFAILPARFPHTPDSYMQGLVTAGIALISSVPLLFGLTFYIFDFGLLKKAFLTAITMTHLALFLPLQVLLQALFLQNTVLFMPVLYIIFGMPINILIIIAFYSWGMSWFFRSVQEF